MTPATILAAVIGFLATAAFMVFMARKAMTMMIEDPTMQMEGRRLLSAGALVLGVTITFGVGLVRTLEMIGDPDVVLPAMLAGILAGVVSAIRT